MPQSVNLAVGAIIVHQFDGLYSLNDLHKASGGEAAKRPSLWVANQQTQELAQEISKAGIPALVSRRGGTSGGTYACRELLIASAAWISAAFHLKVIRVFLAATEPTSAFSTNQQFHADTYGRLAEASCRFGVAQELAERAGMNTDGSDEPARNFCNDVWAIAYLVEDGKALMDSAAAILLPLTLPHGKPTPTAEPERLTPPTEFPTPLAVCKRDPVSPTPAQLAAETAARTWSEPEYAEALLRAMRLSIREVYNLSLKSPVQVEAMYRLGVIGERQITKLRRLMV